MAETDSGKQARCQLHIVDKKHDTTTCKVFLSLCEMNRKDGWGFQEAYRRVPPKNETFRLNHRRKRHYTLYLPKSSGERFSRYSFHLRPSSLSSDASASASKGRALAMTS